MKAKLICTAILALAPGFAAAESNPTESCIDALANEPRLQVLADKLALSRSSQVRLARVAERIAVWMDKRNGCLEAGVAQRRAEMKAPEIAFVRSVFVFQQRLVAELQQGRLTYVEFNERRAELAQAAGTEI